MSIYKLRFNFSATAEGAVNIDIQFDGEITAYWWKINADMDADAEKYDIEVSFLSSNTTAINDARGSITQAGDQASGTPGFLRSSVNAGLGGLRIPVVAGERVHMHGILTGTGSVDAACYLYVLDRADPRLRRRR